MAKHPLIGKGVFTNEGSMAEIITIFPSGSQIGDLALVQYYNVKHQVADEKLWQGLIPVTALIVDDNWIFDSIELAFENAREDDPKVKVVSFKKGATDPDQ